MRAFITSLDYGDLLSISLPYNRHHFSEIHVVTSPEDALTQEVARANGAKVHVTDAWTRGGAQLRKWLALEESLDRFGRHGWVTLLDADVLWPRELRSSENGEHLNIWDSHGRVCRVPRCHLMAPLRRMMVQLPTPFTPGDVPPEDRWDRFPVHRNIKEWAGYSQVFHGCDPALGSPPWHDTGFSHAGCADSEFQARWPDHLKVRPHWHVLHLGEPGVNWKGRATPYLDGTVPEGADDRRSAMLHLWAERRRLRSYQQERLE